MRRSPQGRYRLLTGAAGAAPIPAGWVVTGYSATAIVAGATITITIGGVAEPAVPVPNGGSARGAPTWYLDPATGELLGVLIGDVAVPVSFAFVNTNAFAIELVGT